eukprot:TRINITY_DN3626_c0_g1_i14.p1 TRINITY_DN3626_c0_g1~~TRINITY_DN3626_c0_g1_i14.p1  ORF type:complete len:454 (+),score=103.03 TRINITY_DN3626_c0_g1_i14:47-1408(+)
MSLVAAAGDRDHAGEAPPEAVQQVQCECECECDFDESPRVSAEDEDLRAVSPFHELADEPAEPTTGGTVVPEQGGNSSSTVRHNNKGASRVALMAGIGGGEAPNAVGRYARYNSVDDWLQGKPGTPFWRATRRVQSARNCIFLTLVYPAYSATAKVMAVLSLLTVTASVAVFTLSAQPQFIDDEPRAFFVIEYATQAIFTAELLVKALTTSSLRWFVEAMTIVDVITIVPFYVELAMPSVKLDEIVLLRVLRLLRMFRIFQIGRFNSSLQVMREAFLRSRDSAILLLNLLFIELTMFASLIFFTEGLACEFDAERHVWVYTTENGGGDSPFQSIPASYWWCMVTITTTGFGDTYPHTPLGKAVASAAMVCGLVTLAFPISILSANFTTAWEEAQEREAREREERERQRVACAPTVHSAIRAVRRSHDTIKRNKISEFPCTHPQQCPAAGLRTA